MNHCSDLTSASTVDDFVLKNLSDSKRCSCDELVLLDIASIVCTLIIADSAFD